MTDTSSKHGTTQQAPVRPTPATVAPRVAPHLPAGVPAPRSAEQAAEKVAHA